MPKTRRLKPEDKHVTRKELLAELLIVARAADESIAQFRAEVTTRLAKLEEEPEPPPYHDVNPSHVIPTDSEGPE